MKTNLEIKVQINDLSKTRNLAKDFCKWKKHSTFTQKQEDIYYKAESGRLKLRIIDGKAGNFIHYHRANTAPKRVSEYTIAETDTPAPMKDILKSLFGVLVTVRKTREIFIVNNIRIHLDSVAGLGKFLEFEVIFSSLKKAEREIEKLIKHFGLDEKQFIKVSYSDLLLKKRRTHAG